MNNNIQIPLTILFFIMGGILYQVNQERKHTQKIETKKTNTELSRTVEETMALLDKNQLKANMLGIKKDTLCKKYCTDNNNTKDDIEFCEYSCGASDNVWLKDPQELLNTKNQ